MLFGLILSVKSLDNAYFTDDGQLIFPDPIEVETYPKGTRRNLDESGWKNIRIKLNYSYITGELRDPLSCYEEGQVVKVTSTQSVTCTKEMALLNFNMTNLTITMNNLKEFAEKFLKVIPTPNKDYDLKYIVKINRYPKGSSVAARAGYLETDNLHRLILSQVLINQDHLVKYVSQFETNRSTFINIMFHEFTHALGAIHSYYHHRNSTLYYSTKQQRCTLSKYGKNYTFLTGPYSHLFAQKHYGVDVFVGDDKNCSSGIELEDGFEDIGSDGSHIKASRFFTDLNIGMSVQQETAIVERITDATIAILQDTGNYICNWSMARPLVWGNRESQIGGEPIKDFALGPPQLVFPELYLAQGKLGDSIGFDYKYTGMNLGSPYDSSCDGYWAKLCSNKEFYNPLNLKYLAGYDIFDYALVKMPFESCKEGEAIIPGVGGCRKYICDKYDSFTLITPEFEDINGSETNITCTRDNPNETITVRNSNYKNEYENITCVHPELFCRTVMLSEMHFVRDPFDPDLSVTQLDDPYEKSNKGKVVKIVVPCVILGIIIIAVIVIIVIIIRKKQHSNEENDDEEVYDHKNDDIENIENTNKPDKPNKTKQAEAPTPNTEENYLSD